MHYIGKSYVTTVYKCDDEKNLMTLKKKCDKCIQMHYIGKSYVTTVYKCDNRLRRAVIREYMGQIFSDEAPKKRDKCLHSGCIAFPYIMHCIHLSRFFGASSENICPIHYIVHSSSRSV